MSIYDDTHDPKRDVPRERKVDVPGSTSAFVITRTDPFGFYYVSREKGTIPAKLSGAYTTFQKASEAVNLYLNSQQPEPKKVEKVA